MQCKTFPGKLLKNDKKMQQKDNSKSKFSKPGKSLLNEFLWFYAADSQCKWKWETIIVESPAWMGQVHIRTFASCVYQRKPLLYLHIRLRSFLLIVMLRMQGYLEPRAAFDTSGDFGTLGVGRRMLLAWPTERNWGTERSGDWWYTSNWGDTTTASTEYDVFQARMCHPMFTGASRKSLCWQSSFAVTVLSMGSHSHYPWQLQIHMLDQLYLLCIHRVTH